jgi:monofunctional biosynthetic peptidoglycan transglycosylase
MKRRKKRETPKKRSEERRTRRRIFLGALFLALAALLFSPVAIISFRLPDVKSLRHQNPENTALMKERAEEAIAEGRTFRKEQQWVPLSRVSPYLQDAVIVTEDATFYTHGGFDWEEIRESIRKNWEEKRFARGASTITQQLAKNLYFGTEKSLRRKILEAITTYRIERTLGKKRILEIYLNVIEWGKGVYGAEAAARHYYGKSAADLDPWEAAVLATTISSPHRFNPVSPGPYLLERSRLALDRMHVRGMLDDETYDRYKNDGSRDST